MGQAVDGKALDTLFREARTFSRWKPRPVTDDIVRDLYGLRLAFAEACTLL